MNKRLKKIICITIIFLTVYSLREWIYALYNLRPSRVHVYPIVGESYWMFLSNMIRRKGFWVVIYGFVLFLCCVALSISELIIDMKEESSLFELTSRLIMIMVIQIMFSTAFETGIIHSFLLLSLFIAYIAAELLYIKSCLKLNQSVVSIQHCIAMIIVYFVLNSILIHDFYLITVMVTAIGVIGVLLSRYIFKLFNLRSIYHQHVQNNLYEEIYEKEQTKTVDE